MKTLALLDFSYPPINLIDHGQITKKLEIQEFSLLSIRHRLIRYLTCEISLSCLVPSKVMVISVKSYGDFFTN